MNVLKCVNRTQLRSKVMSRFLAPFQRKNWFSVMFINNELVLGIMAQSGFRPDADIPIVGASFNTLMGAANPNLTLSSMFEYVTAEIV